MTPSSEPKGPLTPTDEAVIDAWFARQHRDTGTDLAAMLELNLGLHDILLAGHHRDMGADLAGALDLATGLAAIVPRPTRNEPPPTQFDNFTHLLNWLSTAHTLRLTHRIRLRLLAIDTEILHLASTLAHDRARALDRDRAADRDRVLDLLHARARAIALALDRPRDLDRDINLNRTLTLTLGLATELDRGRDPALDRDRERALDLIGNRDRARDLAVTLCGTVMRLGVGDLVHVISDQTSVDTSWLNPATIGALEAVRLHELCTDFTGVDLREAQLSGVDLVGVRWSSTTRWPPADVDWIVAASEPVGNGVFVIRDTTVNDGAVVVPDPMSV